jgi:hypothetical protein
MEGGSADFATEGLQFAALTTLKAAATDGTTCRAC